MLEFIGLTYTEDKETMIETLEPHKSRKNWWIAGVFLTVMFLVLIVWQQTLPPKDFPIDSVVNIPRGLSASSIAHTLEEQGVVKSNLLLYFILTWSHDPANIQAGTFVYSEPLNVWQVAERLTMASSVDNLVAVTLPEGFTIKEFAELASNRLVNFDKEHFIELSEGREGYLFPDTYYLPNDFTAEELVNLLSETYVQKTADLNEEITAHHLTQEEIIILASILEREANTEECMRIVSGILQNRLDIGMALQADATMEYALDRPLNQLEASDLEIDSPYNTYIYKGLPPTPIGNPGLMAINAVLNPIVSDYFYYLTDDEGNFYYAETFDEHRANIAKYLR